MWSLKHTNTCFPQRSIWIPFFLNDLLMNNIHTLLNDNYVNTCMNNIFTKLTKFDHTPSYCTCNYNTFWFFQFISYVGEYMLWCTKNCQSLIVFNTSNQVSCIMVEIRKKKIHKIFISGVCVWSTMVGWWLLMIIFLVAISGY